MARLPVTGKEIFGREEDLAFLDAAWADTQVNVVCIVAWAGVGKSTLVNHWLRGLAAAKPIFYSGRRSFLGRSSPGAAWRAIEVRLSQKCSAISLA